MQMHPCNHSCTCSLRIRIRIRIEEPLRAPSPFYSRGPHQHVLGTFLEWIECMNPRDVTWRDVYSPTYWIQDTCVALHYITLQYSTVQYSILYDVWCMLYAVRCLIFASHPHDFHHYIMMHKLSSVMIMIMIMISIEVGGEHYITFQAVNTIQCTLHSVW